jgi:hypothetical protein
VFHHLVLLKPTDSTTDARRQAMIDAFLDFPKSIPQIRSLSCGTDLGIAPVGNWDVGIHVSFDALDDYKIYAEHPHHKKFGTEVLEPIMADGTTAQFESA